MWVTLLSTMGSGRLGHAEDLLHGEPVKLHIHPIGYPWLDLITKSVSWSLPSPYCHGLVVDLCINI